MVPIISAGCIDAEVTVRLMTYCQLLARSAATRLCLGLLKIIACPNVALLSHEGQDRSMVAKLHCAHQLNRVHRFYAEWVQLGRLLADLL